MEFVTILPDTLFFADLVSNLLIKKIKKPATDVLKALCYLIKVTRGSKTFAICSRIHTSDGPDSILYV